MNARAAVLLVGLCGAAGCCKPEATTTTTAAPRPAHTIDRAGMDPAVKPGDDFFGYANGAWLAKTEIPADRSAYGIGAMVDDVTQQRIVELIQEAAKAAAPGSEAAKVGDFYASYLDEAAIERAGLAPLQPELDRIAAIHDTASLSAYLGTQLRADVDLFNNTITDTPNLFGLWVAQDLDDPARYIPFLVQGGLGMPDRAYYLDESPKMADLRAKYLAHVQTMLGLLQRSPDAAAKIVALETAIARVHVSRTETEDVHKGNNHWPRAELAKRAPGIDWDAFLAAAGLARSPDFLVWQPTAFAGIAALVGAATSADDLAVWRDYLAVHALDRQAERLPHAVDQAHFAFFGTALSGTTEQRVRWKRAVAEASDGMGQAVGKLYVAKYFPASEKARVQEMVKRELAAFADRIDHLAWMSPATKQKAKAKLAALRVGVGYPDKWIDYGALEVKRGDAFGNAQRAERFQYARELAKLGKPVDRDEWVMNPQLVNAVNLPAMNALNFPAAILQPPYLDPARPLVQDYAATGATIGHEISHSFDDQGAQFDATGKLANWWTPDDLAHFEASSQALAAQYDGYKPFPDLAVNGAQTVSENIADTAGLTVAYEAYRAAYGGKEAPTIDGFTGDQQFFLAYAQHWRTKYREEALRRRVHTDGHAPAEYRADTVRNLDAWYPAFGIQPGDKLALPPGGRVHVW